MTTVPRPEMDNHHAAESSLDRLRRLAAELASAVEEIGPMTSDDEGQDGASVARVILKARRLRDQMLGQDLFSDPGWDILLSLFASSGDDCAQSLSSLAVASQVPPTTALRWIASLEEQGAISRLPDPVDRRRQMITLSPSMRERMSILMGRLRDGGGGAV